MFDTVRPPRPLEDRFAWAEIERDLRQGGDDRTFGNTSPSGLFALEIDTDTQHADGLSDAQLIDAMVGFERLTAWAEARQARLLAEFARRRPGDDPTLVATDKPCTMSRYAPDEVGLALKLARGTAKARLGRSVQLEQVLPETLALWQQGRLDERRVAAICDATHYLPEDKARAVQRRVLDRAPAQTVGQLKEALKRAVIHVDPEGAAERHKAARRDRRVALGEEHDGMASLWMLLTAADAHSCLPVAHPPGPRLRQRRLPRHGRPPRRPRRRPAVRPPHLGRTRHRSGRQRQPGDTDAPPTTETDTEAGHRGGHRRRRQRRRHRRRRHRRAPTAAPAATHGTGTPGGRRHRRGGRDRHGRHRPPRPPRRVPTPARRPRPTRTTPPAPPPRPPTPRSPAPDRATATDAGADADEGAGGDSGTAGSGTTDSAANRSDAAGAGGSAPPGDRGGGGGSPPRPVNPGKPLVQVLMPFTTLIGKDDQPCELVGYGAIPADLAREIAADATLKRLVYDELSGTLLDYGRTTYRPPAGLADHVRARDVHCRGPICRRRALDGHLDHIEPYPKGPTNEKNLHGCCGHEHLMKHAPGWAVRALPDGRIQWITPTGHRYHSYPYDYRPDEPDDELPPDKAPTSRDLPKDLAATAGADRTRPPLRRPLERRDHPTRRRGRASAVLNATFGR